MTRTTPAFYFESIDPEGNGSSRFPRADSPAVAARRPGPFQNSSTRAARRAFAAIRSVFESFDFLEAAKDVGTVIALALFVGVTSFAVIAAIFILFFCSL